MSTTNRPRAKSSPALIAISIPKLRDSSTRSRRPSSRAQSAISAAEPSVDPSSTYEDLVAAFDVAQGVGEPGAQPRQPVLLVADGDDHGDSRLLQHHQSGAPPRAAADLVLPRILLPIRRRP